MSLQAKSRFITEAALGVYLIFTVYGAQIQ